jgi:2-polyprenyl-3-methyl-5-hydroxy-6-metoxy-1,4-benzoquinol methylase
MAEADLRLYPRNLDKALDIVFRHVDRYLQAAGMAGHIGAGERWLDAACGSGYGTQLLSHFASRVVGYDIDPEAVSYAARTYHGEGIEFASVVSGVFDVVIAVEVVEHMPREQAQGYLQQLASWTREGGVVVVSTPILERSNPHPPNPHHCYEYSLVELTELCLAAGLPAVEHKLYPVTFTDGTSSHQGILKLRR